MIARLVSVLQKILCFSGLASTEPPNRVAFQADQCDLAEHKIYQALFDLCGRNQEPMPWMKEALTRCADVLGWMADQATRSTYATTQPPACHVGGVAKVVEI